MFKGRVTISRGIGFTKKFMDYAAQEAPTKCSVKGCHIVSKGHDGYLQHWHEAHDSPNQNILR